jgi:hypothetical protein
MGMIVVMKWYHMVTIWIIWLMVVFIMCMEIIAMITVRLKSCPSLHLWYKKEIPPISGLR